MSKFTNIEAALLKRLYKGFTTEDLNKIAVKTISTTQPYWDVEKKYINLMKLYGLMPEPNRFGGYDTDKLTELTKYAKWVLDNTPDNWPEDEIVDFKNIENPIKAEMKRYEVSASESGSQAIYRSGWVEILAWDQEDAEEKGVEDFYDWGGDMEDDDYGDWYGDGIELDDVTLKEQRRLARKYGIISHQPVRPGDMINEHIPQPGSSSAEGIKDDTLPYETKHLTLDEILTTVKSIPYYKEVLMDLRDDKDDWAVTQTVKRYAKYWMEHPESLTSEDFPPIQVIGDGLKDGAHRISTLNALANHIDPDNSYWTDVKLEVRFYPIEIVKDIGPTWVNGKLVYNTKDGLNSKSLNESTLKINPELRVDDIVRVIDVDGEHGRMPKRFGTYIVVKVGKTYPLMAMRNRGHDNEYYEIRPYPDSSTQFSEFDIKTLYRGDTWIYGNIPMATKVDRKTISEAKLEINPELELGDKIRVISVDRDVESKSIKYHIPPPELKPDLYVSYVVVDKESNGSESKYPFRYTLIPEDKYQDYLNGDYWVKRDTSKLLFPWLNQWIYAKETETINEHKKSKFNPELKIGDEIIVIDVGVEVQNDMNKPDKYVRYFVTKIYGNKELDIPLEDVPNHLFDTPEGPHYYGLNRPDVDVTDPDNPGVFDRSSTHKHLYPRTDTWMFNPKGPTMRYEDAFQPEVYMSDEEYEELYGDDGMDEEGGYLNEHKQSKFNPQLMVGDEVTVVNVDKSYGTKNTPKHLKDYSVIGIRYRQPENWEGPDADTKFYIIEPLSMTDDERLGGMLAGGGRRKEEHLYSTDTWMLKKGFLRGELGEHEEEHQSMSKDEVQTIVDKVYPHIINNLGESIYVDELPKVELWEDIYARLSKIPGATGEESESSEAQYDDKENKIFVYYPNMKDVKHVIQSLLHEYTHYLQDPDESEENRKDGYENDPYETAASEAEENWEDYMVYLKDNLNEQLFNTKKIVDYTEEIIGIIRDTLTGTEYTNFMKLWEELDEGTTNWLGKNKPLKMIWGGVKSGFGATYNMFNNTINLPRKIKDNGDLVVSRVISELSHVKQMINDGKLKFFMKFLTKETIPDWIKRKFTPKQWKEHWEYEHEGNPEHEAHSIIEPELIKLVFGEEEPINLNEKFASKAQQRFLYATNKKVAKKLGSKMTKKDYEELPDKVEEDLENWSYDGNSIGVEKELDEYCPMGKPNKCKLVDYNNLPDMVKSETIEEQFGKELTMADAIKRDVMKVLSMRFALTPTEDSNIKDANGQSYAIVDTDNPFEEVTIGMLIEPIINMFNDGISGGELSPEDTNIAISGVTDWLSLAMHQTVDLPN